VGPKGAAMKNANITPVIDHEGIVGFIVEFGFDHFEAYFVDNLLGSFFEMVVHRALRRQILGQRPSIGQPVHST